MANETFYPPVTNLISLEDIPDELGFVKDGISTLLDTILYKDLQYTRTPAGDTASYHLSIVSKKRIAIEIPGTGIFLILNPSLDATVPLSIFPISIQYNWPIIGYIGAIDLPNLSFNAASLFELALKVFRLSEKALIERSLSIFLTNTPDPITEFVTQLNGLYGTTIPVPTSPNPVGELITAIKNEPTIDGTAVAIFSLFILDNLDASKTKDNLVKFFEELVQPDVETYLLNLLKPQFDASLKIGAGLEFPRNVLLPVDDAGKPLPEPEKLMLLFEPAEFYFSTSRGIGYEAALNVTLNHKAQVGQTGLGIELTNAKLDISRTSNIAEADQDGRPKEFVGAYIQEAAITLPNFLNPDNAGSTARLVGKNMIIGTGGFSGTVALEAKTAGDPSPVIKANLGGGFVMALHSFALSFQQNTILGSAIAGTLKLPGLKDSGGNDAEINIKIAITDGGNYSITLAEEQGIEVLEIPEVLKLTIKSLSLGKKDNKFFIAVSGKIDFIADLPALGDILPKGIEIKKLIIWQDGSLEFEGGGITLPKAVPLQAGPVKFSVTAIHCGTHKQFFSGQERSYRYFGFDGSISIKPGGVDARGDGIKFYYTNDGLTPADRFLRIEGIGVNLTIPANAKPEKAAVILKGYLAMKTPEPDSTHQTVSTEYIGAISLALPKVNLAGTASLRLNPDIPSFLVDMGVQLSVPIMLGATGLGIYGFRGLIGQKYMPSKTAAGLQETNTWWDYYKSKKPDPPGTEGIHTGKFAQQDGFSVGAGISLATLTDSGKTFSSKLFFMLGLPDVLLLQGQAALLKERISLDDTVDPPFSALLSITGQSVEAAFGVNYKLPDSGNSKGDILTLQVTLEMAFFFNNAKGWYINLGRETPEEKRVQAKVLRLFNGYSFLMLSSAGGKMGAGINWELKRSYGPVKIELGAFLHAGASLILKPLQIGGFIQVGGFAHVRVFRFTLGFDVSAGLTAEGPKPYIITGCFQLKFKIKLFWFLKISYNIKVQLSWNFANGFQLDQLPIIGALSNGKVPAIAYNMLSKEVFPVGYHGAGNNSLPAPTAFPGGLPVIPMDCYIDVDFLQAVKPGADNSLELIGYTHAAIATDHTVIVPPEKAKTDQVIHECTIESIKVLHWDGTQWKNYYVYEAVSAINSLADLPGVTVEDHTSQQLVISDLKKLKAGYWQLQQPGRFDKLRILSQNMFSYQTDGTPGGISIDGQLFSDETIFCPPVLKEICVNWEGQQYTGVSFTPGTPYSFNGIYVLSGEAMVVNPATNPHGFVQGLHFTKDLHIRFVEPTSKITLKLLSFADSVAIHYCNFLWQVDEEGHITGMHEILETKIIQAAQLAVPVVYDNIEKPVDKIIIESGHSQGMLNESPLQIGNDTRGLGHTFTGAIDEVRLFNKALSREEISKTGTGNQLLPGLVAGWSLDQTTVEITGEHPGVIIPPVSWIAGVHDQAAVFENSGSVAVLHDPALSFGETSFSISAWVRLKREISTGQHTIVEKMDSWAGSNFGYSLLIVDGELVFDLAYININRYRSQRGIADDQWKHVAVTVDSIQKRLRFYVDGQLMRELVLISTPPVEGNTVLFGICYTNYKEALEYENQIGGIDMAVEVTAMENGLTKRFQPIWRPNTQIAIQIETRDKVAHGNTVVNNNSFFHTVAFQTSGILGHFHKNHPSFLSLAAQGREDEYKLSKLQHYIDFERSYPNADGKLINAKPLFYAAVELLLFFRHAYIYSMFTDWQPYQGLGKVESALEITVLDAESNAIQQGPSWNFQQLEGGFGEDIIKLNKFVQHGQNCTSTQVIKPFGVQLLYHLPDLKPEKLYTALFNAVYRSDLSGVQQKSEVHKYVFQTSRYSSFAAQVDSYLQGTVKAVFNIALTTNDADVNTAIQILNDTLAVTDALISQFADPYDRLLQGALKLPALDAPAGTEFNIIKRKDNGRILGILVRNPEPLNDPKLPAAEKQRTVAAKLQGADLISLVAKEPSRIFISNASMDLPVGDVEYTFNYFLFNGSLFALKDQRIVTITVA